MKKIGKKISILLLTTAMFILMFYNEAKATYIVTDIEVQEVEDVDNVPYPKTKDISILGAYDQSTVKFELPSSGTVKTYVRIANNTNGKGSVWISMDEDGKDVIGDVVNLSQSGSIKEFLDKGTYYIQTKWSQTIYDAGIAILYEKSYNDEDHEKSSFNNPTVLELNQSKRGFITSTSPIDFYIFQLDETAYLDIQYSFDAPANSKNKSAELTLYNRDRVVIGSNFYQANDRGSLSAKYRLDPGQYYIALNGFKGDTVLNLMPMYYRTTLIPSTEKWTKKEISVKINTTIEFSNIDVIKYNADEADLKNNYLWQLNSMDEKYVETLGTTFIAKSNGIYSIRIKDEGGNYTLEKIEIKVIDDKKPTVKGVKNEKYYNTSKTISWSDKASGIKKVTLNGKEIEDQITVTQEGNYTLKVYDKVGNIRTLKFYIDKTRPTINGIKNGSTYERATVSFTDNLSGIKKITINGEEKSSYSNTIYFRDSGSYSIKVWDHAGNATSANIKIK